MSRMSPVRSITLQFHARSRLRCCTGESAASTMATVTPASAMARACADTCPSPSKVAGRRPRCGRIAVCTTTNPIDALSPTRSASRCSADRRASGRCPASPRSCPRRSHGSTTAALVGATKAPFRREGRRPSSVACGRRHLPRRNSAFRLGGVEQLNRRTRHHGSDRVLVYQLRVYVPTQQDGKVVKPSDYALELNPVHQEHGHRRLVLPHMVQENILNILRLLIGHGDCPSSYRLLFLFGPGGRGTATRYRRSISNPLPPTHEAVRQDRAR